MKIKITKIERRKSPLNFKDTHDGFTIHFKDLSDETGLYEHRVYLRDGGIDFISFENEWDLDRMLIWFLKTYMDLVEGRTYTIPDDGEI